MRQFSPFCLLLASFLAVACQVTGPTDSAAATATAVDSASATPDATAPLRGAWTTEATTENGEPLTLTTIVMDGYLAEAAYNRATRRFERTWGGKYTIDRDTFSATVEFDSADPARVGKRRSLVFELEDDRLTFPADRETWTRLDAGERSPLAGAWLITGRERDGEMTRWTPGERKTMKILSDGRFQWIAFHVGTGAFSGTGGGTYTAEDGKYVERIEFFSRDSSRVGAELGFDYELVEGEWHHRGLSSKGDPIYEIWTLRKTLE